MTQFSTLVQQLLDPTAYPEHPVRVEVRETQISVVFLTGTYAYKIKKPLAFSFVDFTTLESRRINCEREVTLNRRLAPDVYLGVVPIAHSTQGLRVDGTGEAVEYAVKMVQLPEEGMLDHLLQEGKVDEAMIRRLAKDIAAFHEQAVRGPKITGLGGFLTTSELVEGNLRDGEEFPDLLLAMRRGSVPRASAGPSLSAARRCSANGRREGVSGTATETSMPRRSASMTAASPSWTA